MKLVKLVKPFHCQRRTWLNLENVQIQTKPKGVTTQMKALSEYILMVLFVLSLKRVHFLANET